MSQRVERVAGEVRAVVGEVLARDEIKDPRVRGAGLITVTHVRVSGDLQHAWAQFTVHGLHAAGLEVVRQGLNSASGYFRQAIARRLRMKVAPAVKFEVDTVFEKADRIETILREERAARAKSEANAESEAKAESEANAEPAVNAEPAANAELGTDASPEPEPKPKPDDE